MNIGALRTKITFFALLLLFAGLTVRFTAPLSDYLSKSLPYSRLPMQGWEFVPTYQGDHLQQYYHFWMAYDFLRTGGNFFTDPYEFCFEDLEIFSTRRLLLSLVFMPLALAAGPVAAYNLLTLLAIFLAAAAMFLYVRFLQKKQLPAAYAAVLYAFSPFGLSQLLGGHTNGFLLWMFPLIFWFSHRLLETGRLSFFLGVTPLLATFAFMEYHLLYFTFLVLPPYLLLLTLRLLGAEGPDRRKRRVAWLRGAFFLALAAALSAAIMMYIKHVEIKVSSEKKGRTLQEVSLNSPAPADLFHHANDNVEKNVYLGLVGALLGAGAVLRLGVEIWRRRRLGYQGLAAYFWDNWLWFYFSALAVFCLVLSLGTSLPGPVYRLCHEHLPYFNYIRSPARIFVLCVFSLGVLGALVLKKIAFMLPPHRFKSLFAAGISLSALGLNIMDLRPTRPVGLSLLETANPVYDFVAQNLRSEFGEKIMMVPLWPGDSAWSSVYLYYITLHRFHILNGYYPLVPQRYKTEFFFPVYGINVGALDKTQHELLLRQKVRFVVVHQDAFPQKVSHYPSAVTVERLKNCPFLQYLQSYRTLHLFRVLPKGEVNPPAGHFTPIAGMFFEESMFNTAGAVPVNDPKASGGRALCFDRHSTTKGLVLSGRKQILPPGNYRAFVRMKTADTDRDAVLGRASIRVGGAEAATVALSVAQLRTASGAYRTVELPFTLQESAFPELILEYTDQAADLYFDSLYILDASQSDPLTAYEAEDTFTATHAVIVNDSEASGGRAVAALDEQVPMSRLEVVFGPYRRYPAGRYQAEVFFKTLQNGDASPAEFEITADWGRSRVATATLPAGPGGSYRSARLDFTLAHEEVLELRVVYNGHGDLYIDRFTVQPQS